MIVKALRSWLYSLRDLPGDVARTVGSWSEYIGLVFKTKNIYIALAAMALLGLAAYWMDFDSLYLTITFILVLMEVLLIVVYLPAFLAALISSPLRNRDQLILGIWLAWTVDLITRVWAMTQRYTPSSEWMMTSDFLNFILFGRLLSVVLHITAPDAVDGRVSSGTWIKIAVGFILGVGVSYVLTALTFGVHLDVG